MSEYLVDIPGFGNRFRFALIRFSSRHNIMKPCILTRMELGSDVLAYSFVNSFQKPIPIPAGEYNISAICIFLDGAWFKLFCKCYSFADAAADFLEGDYTKLTDLYQKSFVKCVGTNCNYIVCQGCLSANHSWACSEICQGGRNIEVLSFRSKVAEPLKNKKRKRTEAEAKEISCIVLDTTDSDKIDTWNIGENPVTAPVEELPLIEFEEYAKVFAEPEEPLSPSFFLLQDIPPEYKEPVENPPNESILEKLKADRNHSYLLKSQITAKDNRDQWLDVRLDHITATDVNTILFGARSSKDKKMREKVQRMVSPFVNVAMLEGLKKEPEMLEAIAKFYNAETSSLPFVEHPKYPWLGASPDGIIMLHNKWYLIEMKLHMRKESFVRSIPKSHRTQMQIQMEVCNINQCIYAQYFPGCKEENQAPKLKCVTYKREPEFFKANVKTLENWWKEVEQNREPKNNM